MNVFPHRRRSIRRQHKYRNFIKLLFSSLFSPQYSLRTVLFATVLIALGSIAYIWQWAQYLQEGYDTQALHKEKTVLQKRIALLEIEVSFLTRLDRLDQIATEQMKMRLPSPAQRLTLPKPTDEAQ